jgi:hypothetical protein
MLSATRNSEQKCLVDKIVAFKRDRTENPLAENPSVVESAEIVSR